MAKIAAYANPGIGKEANDGGDQTFPIRTRGGTMICICGYELHKQDENTYRCLGGSHMFHLDEGDIVLLSDGTPAIRRRRG